FNFCSDCDSDELRCVQNKEPKNPQNLKDCVHSLKNTKNKNQTSVSTRKTNLDGNLKDNVSQIGEKSACDREGSLVDEEISGNKGFVDDLNGDQDKVDDLGDIKDCLDQDIGDNGNRNVDDENSANRSDGCVSEPVCQDKVDKITEKESDVNGGRQVTYSEARYHLRRMWNQFGYIDLMKNDGGVFFFKFQDEKGKPIIMDEMTARMCAKGEGRLNFARVLIEVEAKKFYNGRGNNGKWDYKKKQDTSMGNSSGRNEIRRNSSTVDNVDKANEIHDDNVDKSKEKGTMDESNMKCNKEKISSSAMKASTSNRFTLLNALVGNEELIPSVEERKIVDEYMNKENEGAKEIEIEEDVEEVIPNLEEEFGVREEITRGMRISLGMSTSDKQKEVRNLMNEEKLQLCGIIETHVKYSKILKIGEKVFGNWDLICNGKDNN
ncbi:hypothetical protein Tco_1296327, partial [Tanacetum coccineum]